MIGPTLHQVLSYLNIQVPWNPDFPFSEPRAPTDLGDRCITLLTRANEDLFALFEGAPARILAIVTSELRCQMAHLPQTVYFTDRPRLVFCEVLTQFFVHRPKNQIASTATVETSASLSPKLRIGHGTIILGDVQIGEGTVIEDRVVIHGPVVLGRDCYIKSGAVIGQKGFGFERNASGTPVAFPHFGRVRIGDRVEIGAGCTIARGALGETVLEDDVKIDDQVHIAHNVRIGEATMIAACVTISGSVTIGAKCYIAPQATLINHISVGNEAFIGIGALVVRSLPSRAKMAGRPAIMVTEAGETTQ